MSESNAVPIRRFIEEGVHQRNIAVIDEVFAPDFLNHNAIPGTAADLGGYKDSFRVLLAAFPDLRITIEDLISEGDKLAARVTLRATHMGDLMGISPTGKQITVTAIAIVRISGGKIAERWEQLDMLGLMQQLGAVPAHGEAGG